MVIHADSYDELWQQVEKAEKSDLPKTQIEVLDKIAQKATREKAYGQLLAARMRRVSVQTDISGDSLRPAVDALIAEAEAAEKSDPVLAAIYYTSLHRLVSNSYQLKREYPEQVEEFRQKAMSHPEKLAAVKDDGYRPLVTKGDDSSIYGHDLLHVIGMSVGDYQGLHDYYDRQGNRPAACLCALTLSEQGDRRGDIALLDSLIGRYGDLPECGDVAVRRYHAMAKQDGTTPEQLVAYIDDALGRWPSWAGMNELRNERERLIAPTFRADIGSEVLLPGQERVVKLNGVRHLSSVTMTISRLSLNGDTKLNTYDEKDLAKIRKAITQKDVQTVTRHYTGKADYELTDDSMTIQPLPIGVYLIEFSASGQQDPPRPQLLHVSNLHLLCEGHPGNRIRYVVVNATTGQPVARAKIRLWTERYYDKPDQVETITTGSNGEVMYTCKDRSPYRVYISTDEDKACPTSPTSASYAYYGSEQVRNTIRAYTDRSLYRPGQTVHAAAVAYQVTEGIHAHVLKDVSLQFTLRDANYKTVATKEVVTDGFGSAAADFDLPQSGLTGSFTVVVRAMQTSATAYIHVEEYKRPTFQIEIPEYKEKYENGDTVVVRGYAKSYAGVPVQGAKVSYRVTRRQALWWWYYRHEESDEQLFTGEATTGDDGSFEMSLPMILPKQPADKTVWHPRFYQFVAEAVVTDQGGESHEGSITLPLGTKTTAFGCDLPEMKVRDSLRTLTFTYKNAAGQDIPGQVTYSFDGGKELTGEAGKPLPISLKSGRHHLEARCGNDTLSQDVIVFSMDDKRPVVETNDWFYQSATQFPRDGGPVYVQIGSSDPDQYILYSVFSGEKVLESGVIRQSNALTTRKITYQEKYGSGITITYAWVKNGQEHIHRAYVERALPDTRLKMEWKTFRDRLTPGQQEEWTLVVKRPDGNPADAHVMATLYDQSLDQIMQHQWSLSVQFRQGVPGASWDGMSFSDLSSQLYPHYKTLRVKGLDYSQLDERYFPMIYGYAGVTRHRRSMLGSARMSVNAMVREEPMMMADEASMDMAAMPEAAMLMTKGTEAVDEAADEGGERQGESGQVRENLQETAFFMPSLVTDANGEVTMRFTLPESITTWRFMGLAHDQQMNHGYLDALSVAQKTVMIMPNVPRFIREGDAGTLAARLYNTSEKAVAGTARLELIDPETEKVVYREEQKYRIDANGTSSVVFTIDTKSIPAHQSPLYIARTTAVGDGYSDGEQHYLPILPNREMVLNTYPFTQHEPGVKTVDLTKLFPESSTSQRLTVEYTNNPSWLMIQALPYVGDANEKNAISLAAAFYANSLSREILHRSPRIKATIDQWRMEKPTTANGGETSLMSSLQKDESLKELLLNETPWVMDAEQESDQKQQLARYFDENALNSQLAQCVSKLTDLQNPDGSWSWWPGMRGSLYMTVAVSEMIVRLESMLGGDTQLSGLLPKAYRYMEKEIHEEVLVMKREEKRLGKKLRPSETAVSYLYISSFHPERKNTYPDDITFLVDRLERQNTALTIYGKARTAVVLARHGKTAKASEYLKSIKEYTVFKEEMGRYFDTWKAGYSWFDYRIPSQVAAIEALTTLTPDDRQTIEEMQRWLLQAKRTQAWDTPINSVNAVYAFLGNNHRAPWEQMGDAASLTVLKVNGEPLETPQVTAGIGYVKVAAPKTDKYQTFTAEKTSEGTSWGAVYAQFMQPVTDIEAAASGLTVVREVLPANKPGTPKARKNTAVQKSVNQTVGDKVIVRITITADRDYDFVQVVDKRAACLEPVGQLSGYHGGYYCSPKDYTTNYYFDQFRKGTHVVETEYFIDREGSYQTGTCTVQCAYAPEFSGRAPAIVINSKKH